MVGVDGGSGGSGILAQDSPGCSSSPSTDSQFLLSFPIRSATSDEVINSATATITSDDEDDVGVKSADKDIDQNNDDDEDSAEGSADRMLVF